MTTPTKECPRCQGDGCLPGSAIIIPQSYYQPAEHAVEECHKCGGKGRVNLTRAELREFSPAEIQALLDEERRAA